MILKSQTHSLIFSTNLSDLPVTPHISMGDRIRNALDNGVSESAITPKVYDDQGSDSIDPMSNIRTDKWDMAETAADNAYIASITPAPIPEPPTPSVTIDPTTQPPTAE